MSKSELIRVLQIAGGFRKNVDGKAVSGGVPSFLNNYCQRVNSDRYLFDFMALRNQCFEPYRKQFERNGWNLYCLDLQSNGLKRAFQLIGRLKKFLKENHYDVVHINMGSFFPVLCCAIAAKQANVKLVIAHSHSSGIYSKRKRMIANMAAPFLTIFADKYCACSKLAAENLFSRRIIASNKYHIIRNAIDTDKFKFDEEARNIKRKELGLSEADFVIGHVGRFVEVKNHAFLIDTFAELHNMNPDARLLLVGDGELRAEIEERTGQLRIRDSVVFAGQRSDTWEYYQAMDVFVLPSTVEGLGIVAIEAQAAGLPCYVSEFIPEEVGISDLCKRFKISDGSKALAEMILKDEKKPSLRRDTSQLIREAGYDLMDNVKAFEQLYV